MLKDFKANKHFGNISEEFVCNYLKKNDFIILTQNYSQRFGEIDIIANKQNIIIFVEVKARKNDYFNLSEVITKSKQKKIILTAKYYLVSNKIQDKVCRFDVALLHSKDDSFKLQYFENAFNETT